MATGPEADWIEWSGGESPVDGATIVEVKYRDGEIETIRANHAIFPFLRLDWWKHTGEPACDPYEDREFQDHECDIIAYRVVQA